MKLYDLDRDIIAQGTHYIRHVEAMTAEALHSKSDIAAELAHRDIEIERLQGELANEIQHRDALWNERDQLRDNLAHVVGRASNDPPAAREIIGRRIQLTNDIFDDGQDHHPEAILARKGETVVVRSVRWLEASHENVTDSAFVVHTGEFQFVAEPPAESPWQPIETAPKDLDRVELWIPPEGHNAGYAVFGTWEIQRHSKRPLPYWTTDMERSLGVGWMRKRQPTHWRHMSAGPSVTKSPACATCNDRGEVGGFVNAESGYQNDPCPDCKSVATTDALMMGLLNNVKETRSGFDAAVTAIRAALERTAQPPTERPYRVRAFWSPCRKYLVTAHCAPGDISLMDDNGFIWEASGPEQDVAEIRTAAVTKPIDRPTARPELSPQWWANEFYAWADNPARSGYVPVHPATLRLVARLLRQQVPPSTAQLPCADCSQPRVSGLIRCVAHAEFHGRTDEDYAIEHGRYLATSAERFLAAVNKFDEAAEAESEVDDDDEEARDGAAIEVQRAAEARGDHWRGLESAVYEFRKRADRARPVPTKCDGAK